MYKKIEVEIRGLTPTIMHNGQLADPLNEWVKQMKDITKKGTKKTDADIIELARLEWMGSLYVNDKGRLCWPAENLEALIRSGAKATKSGKDVQAGVLVDDNAELIFPDAKKSVEELWGNASYRYTVGVKVGQSRVMRTRPIFRDWSLEFTVSYNPSVVKSESDLLAWIDQAGATIGLSDFRPKFGRFERVK
jgi:hypothetical protein